MTAYADPVAQRRIEQLESECAGLRAAWDSAEDRATDIEVELEDTRKERDELWAKVADAWDEGWGAAGEAFVEGLSASLDGRELGPQGDGPPNPYSR